MALRDKYGAQIDEILGRYAQKRSAVIQLLYMAQDEYGRLTDDAVREVAAIVDVPPTDVFEVVGFYTLLYDEPMGKWVLQVCDDVPCCFCGAEELVGALEQKLNVTAGFGAEGTTSDGVFTVQRVKCLAACDKAPLLQANLEYFYNVDIDQLDTLLTGLRERAAGQGEGYPGLSGRFADR